jgi:hypothetical protein
MDGRTEGVDREGLSGYQPGCQTEQQVKNECALFSLRLEEVAHRDQHCSKIFCLLGPLLVRVQAHRSCAHAAPAAVQGCGGHREAVFWPGANGVGG